MTSVHILGLLSIQKISAWNLKADTVNLTLTVPGTPSGGPEAVYYLVSDDGGSYRILNATLRDASAGTMTFVVSPKADSGLFTLVEAGASAPMATAEPMPTAAAPRIAEMSVSSASLLPAIDPVQFAGILGAAVVLFGAALFMIYSATRRN
jgi:hypothetical protein